MSKNGKPEIMSAWDFMARVPADKDARGRIEWMRWAMRQFVRIAESHRISRVKNEKPQPYRCKDCRKHFSVTTGTVFHSANLSPRKCLYAIYLMVIAGTDAAHLQGAVRSELKPGSTLYTDGHRAYRGMHEYRHEAVEHSVGEYVRGMAHTQGIESFWALLKRGYIDTFHHFSEKHMAPVCG